METKYILVALAMFGAVVVAEKLNGPCPRNHRTMTKVDWLRLHERWFVVQQSNPNPEDGSKCAQVHINFALPYLNFTIIKKLSSGEYKLTPGRGLIRRNSGRVTMFVNKTANVMSDVTLEVLATDYYSYALVYYCQNVGPFSSYQGTYVLSRTSGMDENIPSRFQKMLKENGLKTTDTYVNNIQDCGVIDCHGDYGNCTNPAVQSTTASTTTTKKAS